eukprot:5617963-Alexandrium_andersonii.AAC.1
MEEQRKEQLAEAIDARKALFVRLQREEGCQAVPACRTLDGRPTSEIAQKLAKLSDVLRLDPSVMAQQAQLQHEKVVRETSEGGTSAEGGSPYYFAIRTCLNSLMELLEEQAQPKTPTGDLSRAERRRSRSPSRGDRAVRARALGEAVDPEVLTAR